MHSFVGRKYQVAGEPKKGKGKSILCPVGTAEYCSSNYTLAIASARLEELGLLPSSESVSHQDTLSSW